MGKATQQSIYSDTQLQSEFLELYKNLNSIDSTNFGVGLSSAWKTTWTPTYSASGAMTYTTVTTNRARYFRLGRTVWFEISATGTTGGVASTSLIFTLPFTAATGYQIGGGAIVNDGAANVAGFYEVSSTTAVAVKLAAAGNWGLGANRSFIVNGFYETAI